MGMHDPYAYAFTGTVITLVVSFVIIWWKGGFN